MKTFKLALIGAIISLNSISSFAQVTPSNEKKSTKIDVFTPQEKGRIQLWLNDQTANLNLTEDQLDDYRNIILTNVNAIFHLTDSNINYSLNEIDEKTNGIFTKINKQTEPIMDASQFQEHELTMKKFQAAYINRLYNPSEETNLYNYLKEKGELVEKED